MLPIFGAGLSGVCARDPPSSFSSAATAPAPFDFERALCAPGFALLHFLYHSFRYLSVASVCRGGEC